MDALPPPPPELAGVVFSDPEAVRAASGSRGPIWMPPRAVVRPRSVDDVAAAVAWCGAEGLALTPRGGGTGMPGGNVGRSVVLDLSALDRTTLHDDGTLTAQAGALAAAADARARERGRHLPALPSSAPWCTVGGMVATDAAGARSFRYGPIHAWTRGLEMVGSDGGTASLDRRQAPVGVPPWGPLRARLAGLSLAPPRPLRKNASGYAVHRFVETGDPIQLLAGSEGTLAVVTEVHLETEPLPEARGVALVGVPTVDALPEAADRAEATGATACEYFGRRLLELGRLLDDPRVARLDGRAGVLLVEYAGSAPEVEAGLAAWPTPRLATTDADTMEGLWGLRHDASPAIARAAGDRRSLQFMEDCVVPRASLPAFVRGVEAALTRHGLDAVIFGHAGDGNLHVNPLVEVTDPRWRATVRDTLDEVVDLVAGLGGTLSGEHGDGRLRAPLLGRIWGREYVAAFRLVKDTLDPAGILNPGVILPSPGQDVLEGLGEGPDLQRIARVAPAEA